MRILLVDDHTLFRIALRKLLQSLFPPAAIYDVCDGLQAVDFIRKNAIDVVLLDLAMPGMNGFELITYLRKTRLKNFKIIALTNYTETAVVYNLLRQGVEGYLPKNVDDTVLAKAIQITLLGGIYYPEEYSVRIRDFVSAGEIPVFELSKNEVKIIRLLANGKSSKQIAAILNYTVGSIDTKRYRLEKKLFAKSTAELVAKAINLGIVRFSSNEDSLD